MKQSAPVHIEIVMALITAIRDVKRSCGIILPYEASMQTQIPSKRWTLFKSIQAPQTPTDQMTTCFMMAVMDPLNASRILIQTGRNCNDIAHVNPAERISMDTRFVHPLTALANSERVAAYFQAVAGPLGAAMAQKAIDLYAEQATNRGLCL